MREPDALPDHLRPLLPGRWAIWRDFAVRAPGFSIDGLDDFGPGENERLRARAHEPRFREAVLWQNAAAARTAVSGVADAPADATNKKTRQRRELVASYWQRYCAKNDTIGFFGPLGWGRFADDGPPIDVRPGEDLIASRHVRFEVWAIEALAAAIAANPVVRPRVPPHRRADRFPRGLPPDQMAAWAMCDGVRPACAIAPRDVIDALERGGFIRITFPVPLCPDPEHELRLRLSRLEPADVRHVALAVLDELESARRQVIDADGPDALDRALGALDEVFVRLTDTAPTRQAGLPYGARTLVYLDCRRDLRVDLGPALREALAETLEPILAGSRWFCGEVADACRRLIEPELARVREKLRSDTVPLGALAAAVIPQLKAIPPEVRHANDRLQERWATLLANPDPIGFAERAAAVFADNKPAWRMAVWQAPDVQIAARCPDDINRGDYQIVVGDSHQTNTLLQGLFTILSPDPDSVIAAASHDVPPPRLFFAPDRSTPRLTGRIAPIMFGPDDFLVMADAQAAVPDGQHALAATDLSIASSPAGPVVVTRDGEVAGLLDELLGFFYYVAARRTYDPFPPAAHSPRLQVGRSVLRRETWNVPIGECAWAFEPDSARRSASFAAWAAGRQMPRRVFVLVPGEAKPLYVDSQSAVLVDVLARAVRGGGETPESAAAAVRFTEMLPTPEQCWLTDAAGGRYTSELRMVAVDLTRYPA